MRFHRFQVPLMAFLLPWAVACTDTAALPAPKSQPNILLLVADDLGYTDLGCFGGDIATPNLDSLAYNGIRFSNFHTAPMCAPTRAMLLSGTYSHIAGMGRQNLELDVFGYEGYLTNRIVPLPALLKKAGYHTLMAGKWHLGSRPGQNAPAKGFDQSFVLMEGVGNHYNGKGIFKGGPSNYQEDGKAVPWPEGKYSTDLYTDRLIAFLEQSRESGKPFFAYAAYTSPHWPLQVDSLYWGKYRGRYDKGYEVLRAERLERLKLSGLVPENARLPEYFPGVIPWADLSAEEKKKEARKMELYAGMLDNLDVNIGRILDYLRETGQAENTIIVFMSDNGAAGEDYYNTEEIRPYINLNYSNEYDNMGKAASLVSYGPAWAEAGSAPFRYFKEYTTNGGILAPLIISGPLVNRKNAIYEGPVTVMDLAPTFYEMAGTAYPAEWEGKPVYPLQGASLLPFVSGQAESVHPEDFGFGMEHYGFTMYRKGSWKITTGARPFSESTFELFNLKEDLAETRDLSRENPAKYSELIREWRNYSREARIQLPTE